MSTKPKSKNEEKGLDPKEELFCQYYINNTKLFGNGTLSYAEAYGYKLDELDNSDEVFYGKQKKYIKRGTLFLAENVCAVSANRLLRKVKIEKRMRELLNELMKDDVVDAELSKMIRQNDDWDVKIAAIREYNKLKARITEKRDLTSDGKPIGVVFLPEKAPVPKE